MVTRRQEVPRNQQEMTTGSCSRPRKKEEGEGRKEAGVPLPGEVLLPVVVVVVVEGY